MKAWLFHIGEDLPVDGDVRRFRYSYLADALTARGHEVIRWAPTFRHTTKQQRFDRDCRVTIDSRYSIQFVHSQGYERNISLQRLRTYRELGRRIAPLVRREPRPDVILAAIPCLEWAAQMAAFGAARDIPVIVDVRDLWPDVFFNALPRTLRSAGRLLFMPYRRLARQACRGATALTGVSQEYLNWALRLAGRPAGPQDRVMPLGFEPPTVTPAERERCLAMLRARGIDPARPTCLFAGLFERSYDLDSVVAAARQLHAAGSQLQFVLCGDGGRLAHIRQHAAALPNFHLLGWVGQPTLAAAAAISTIGLCTYAVDATQSLPNKPFEYMASGLAVVSSLGGELAALLRQHGCGLTYRAGSADSLARTLAKLERDRNLLESMRTQATATWRSHFQSSRIYANFAELLTEAAVRRCAA